MAVGEAPTHLLCEPPTALFCLACCCWQNNNRRNKLTAVGSNGSCKGGTHVLLHAFTRRFGLYSPYTAPNYCQEFNNRNDYDAMNSHHH